MCFSSSVLKIYISFSFQISSGIVNPFKNCSHCVRSIFKKIYMLMQTTFAYKNRQINNTNYKIQKKNK